MGVTFLLRNMHIWSHHVKKVANPWIDNEDMATWLKESGIAYHCAWVRDPKGDFGNAARPFECWQTGISFEDDRHAMLFKLRWGGEHILSHV